MLRVTVQIFNNNIFASSNVHYLTIEDGSEHIGRAGMLKSKEFFNSDICTMRMQQIDGGSLSQYNIICVLNNAVISDPDELTLMNTSYCKGIYDMNFTFNKNDQGVAEDCTIQLFNKFSLSELGFSLGDPISKKAQSLFGTVTKVDTGLGKGQVVRQAPEEKENGPAEEPDIPAFKWSEESTEADDEPMSNVDIDMMDQESEQREQKAVRMQIIKDNPDFADAPMVPGLEEGSVISADEEDVDGVMSSLLRERGSGAHFMKFKTGYFIEDRNHNKEGHPYANTVTSGGTLRFVVVLIDNTFHLECLYDQDTRTTTTIDGKSYKTVDFESAVKAFHAGAPNPGALQIQNRVSHYSKAAIKKKFPEAIEQRERIIKVAKTIIEDLEALLYAFPSGVTEEHNSPM